MDLCFSIALFGGGAEILPFGAVGFSLLQGIELGQTQQPALRVGVALFRGLFQAPQGFREARIQARIAKDDLGQVSLRFGISLCRCFAQPTQRFGGAVINAVPSIVANAQAGLCCGIALLGRFPLPDDGCGRILLTALASRVELSDLTLGECVSFFRPS